ncbi:MAG: hypothetical protein WD886_10830 [Burkholderiales bacterium]
MPATFKDQLAVAEELQAEVRRMEEGERRAAPPPDGYEQELRLAGLAQLIAQAYTTMEGVMSFVARRIDRAPLAGDDWHRKLIERCAQPHSESGRPALLTAPLARDLLELSQFRHVVRNIYPTRLDQARVQENLVRLIRAVPAFASQCAGLAANLPRTPSPRARATSTRRSRS